MTDNVLHAALVALFLALVCVTTVSYPSGVLADERMAIHRGDACRAGASAKLRAPLEGDHSSCS
ncbi:MAG TPA: hypothetical protein VIO33_21485 [Burkholderiaceae bacterium]